MGKKEIITETDAGTTWSSNTALACALLDLKCKFYMGAKNVHAKAQMYLE